MYLVDDSNTPRGSAFPSAQRHPPGSPHGLRAMHGGMSGLSGSAGPASTISAGLGIAGPSAASMPSRTNGWRQGSGAYMETLQTKKKKHMLTLAAEIASLGQSIVSLDRSVTTTSGGRQAERYALPTSKFQSPSAVQPPQQVHVHVPQQAAGHPAQQVHVHVHVPQQGAGDTTEAVQPVAVSTTEAEASAQLAPLPTKEERSRDTLEELKRKLSSADVQNTTLQVRLRDLESFLRVTEFHPSYQGEAESIRKDLDELRKDFACRNEALQKMSLLVAAEEGVHGDTIRTRLQSLTVDELATEARDLEITGKTLEGVAEHAVKNAFVDLLVSRYVELGAQEAAKAQMAAEDATLYSSQSLQHMR